MGVKNGSEWPRLEALLADNPTLSVDLEHCDPYGSLRREAEGLLAQADTLAIDGIEKLAEDASTACKFENLLAEVRFGIMFARLKARVTILQDNQFGRAPTYTPDLRVQFSNGPDILIDVLRLSAGDAVFNEALSLAAGKQNPFRVSYILGQPLSIPALTHQDRDIQENTKCSAASRAAAALTEAKSRGLREGSFHIFATDDGLHHVFGQNGDARLWLPEELERRDDRTASIWFEWIGDGIGYVSGGASALHIVDGDAHASRLLREIQRKAEKWEKLPPEQRVSSDFVVAIQNDETWCLPLTVLSALTGSRTVPGFHVDASWFEERRARYPASVEAASAAGWRRLLDEWDYCASANVVFTEGNFGAYLEGPRWARNVSGVLVAHQSSGPLQWLPNPWARPELNDPRLQDIGFDLAKLGGDRCT